MIFAKKIISAFIISISFQSLSYARIEAIIGSIPLKSNPNIIASLPKTDESEIIISREQYIISYNKFNRSPNWVAWKLDAESLGPTKRSNKFQKDSELENYLTQNEKDMHAVEATEYKGSCFDRGHQIPSADRTATLEDNHATFLMSNMIPQTAYLNRTIWENLESFTRNLIKTQNKKAYIIAGPIYDEDFGAIGPKKDIRIPSKEFKVIYLLDQDQPFSSINVNTPSISVIMPNSLKNGLKPDFENGCKDPTELDLNTTNNEQPLLSGNPNNWENFKAPLAEIEKKASIKIVF